jgi:multidrug efflux pump subunit AcrA (membrane-fusion protein)
MSASLWLLTAAIALTGPDGELPAKNVRKSSPAAATRRSPDERLRALLERSGAGAPLAARTPEGTPDPRTIENCQVTLIDVVDVAAQEAGVLTEVKVREGSEIKEGHLVAQVNDSKVQMARKVAEAEHKVALAEAESDISVRYSKSAAAVAKQDYVVHLEANRRVPGSTPDTEMQKLRLQWEKGTLEIEKAELEQKVAALTAESKEASVEAADDDIHRRKVLAPLDGVVAEVFKHRGEWVNPGDRVVQVLRMDKLRVEGNLNIANVSPADVIGRPVRIIADLTNGRKEEFPGEVVFVDLRVLQGGEYRVKAEVKNRQENGSWLLLPGTNVEMRIDAGMGKLTDHSQR